MTNDGLSSEVSSKKYLNYLTRVVDALILGVRKIHSHLFTLFSITIRSTLHRIRRKFGFLAWTRRKRHASPRLRGHIVKRDWNPSPGVQFSPEAPFFCNITPGFRSVFFFFFAFFTCYDIGLALLWSFGFWTWHRRSRV